MISLRVVTMMWSFFRELILGKKTLAQAAKTNPGKVVLLVTVVASLITNVHVIPKIVVLADRNIALERSYNKLKEEISKGKPSEESEQPETATLPKPRAVKSSVVTSVEETVESDMDWAYKRMEAIGQREAKETKPK
jgi:hypothetical protein